jgi:hypothetical protein
VKQAYRAFAAVPTAHPPEDSAAQVCCVECGEGAQCGCPQGEHQPSLRPRFRQPSMPGPAASPEQLSFRERQKYFELEVRLPQAEGHPKRVSLVGADDLRKMQEEEGEGYGWWEGIGWNSLAWPDLLSTPQPESCSRRGCKCCGRRLRTQGQKQGSSWTGNPRMKSSRRPSPPGLAPGLLEGEGGRVRAPMPPAHRVPHTHNAPCRVPQVQPSVPATRGRRRPGADSQS